MASSSVTIRMDEGLKKQLEIKFNEMGLNMTTAFNMFGRAVIRQNKIPFDIVANPVIDPDMFDNDTDYLNAIPGMCEKIMVASSEKREHGISTEEMWENAERVLAEEMATNV